LTFESRGPKVIRKGSEVNQAHEMESITTYPRRSEHLFWGGGTREYPSKEENQKSAASVVPIPNHREGSNLLTKERINEA